MDPIVAHPSEHASAGALVSDIMHARMTGRLGDLLVLAYDAGVNTGMGLPLERHPNPIVDDLIQRTVERWHREKQAIIDFDDAAVGSLLPADRIPDWLDRLQQKEADHAGG